MELRINGEEILIGGISQLYGRWKNLCQFRRGWGSHEKYREGQILNIEPVKGMERYGGKWKIIKKEKYVYGTLSELQDVKLTLKRLK